MARPAFRWGRILALFLGIGCVVLYLRLNPFDYLAAPIAAALSSIPVAMCFHGITGRSWKASLVSGTSVAIGLGLGTYLGNATPLLVQ